MLLLNSVITYQGLGWEHILGGVPTQSVMPDLPDIASVTHHECDLEPCGIIMRGNHCLLGLKAARHKPVFLHGQLPNFSKQHLAIIETQDEVRGGGVGQVNCCFFLFKKNEEEEEEEVKSISQAQRSTQL